MSLSYRSVEKPAVLIEPTHRRIRLKRGDKVIADSTRAIVIYENDGHPTYYLPKADFAAGTLVESSTSGVSALLGKTRHWSLRNEDGSLIQDVAIAHDGAPIGLAALGDYLTVAWKAVRWFEEDEEIFRQPRNPYRRVDVIASSRRVEVVVDGRVVADTTRAMFLFETNHITRYYLPVEDVMPGILRPSDHTTYCPYKGTASYHHVELDGRVHENIVWSYKDPLDECLKIRDLVSFYNEKVDDIRVSSRS